MKDIGIFVTLKTIGHMLTINIESSEKAFCTPKATGTIEISVIELKAIKKKSSINMTHRSLDV